MHWYYFEPQLYSVVPAENPLLLDCFVHYFYILFADIDLDLDDFSKMKKKKKKKKVCIVFIDSHIFKYN